MSGESLLSGLCSICNIKKFKYCCPGCAARTCSLPCYKRHQQWAQCSGKRDPAKFMKKSQLVTPAGIDHDFNFLSGIERDMEKAERAISATDVIADGNVATHHGKVNYHRLETAGVKVIRAPRGLSRQRENKSHISKTKRANKNIVWTVEWFDITRRRVLSETSSTAHLKDANPFSQNTQRHKSKKRKLAEHTLQSTASTQVEGSIHVSPNNSDSQSGLQCKVDPGSYPDPAKTSPIKQEESVVTKDQDDRSNSGETASNSGREAVAAAAAEHDEQYHFYLLRPRTSTTRHVLIALDSSQTLGESLCGHTVLEFPTIHVFPASMAQLPEEYMLEDEYIKQEGEEQKELDQLLQDLDPETLKRLKAEGTERDTTREEEVDGKMILDVLKQDLGGAL